MLIHADVFQLDDKTAAAGKAEAGPRRKYGLRLKVWLASSLHQTACVVRMSPSGSHVHKAAGHLRDAQVLSNEPATFNALFQMRLQSRTNVTALKEAQHSALGRGASSGAAIVAAAHESFEASGRGSRLSGSSSLAGNTSGSAEVSHSGAADYGSSSGGSGSQGSGSGGSTQMGQAAGAGGQHAAANPLYSDPIAGDGSAFTMPDPAIVLFCYDRCRLSTSTTGASSLALPGKVCMHSVHARAK